MARLSSSGLPYLVRRRDSGKFAYCREVNPQLVPFLSGMVELPWTSVGHLLRATKTVKISLKTGDEQTAKERWGLIHGPVQAMFNLAMAKAKEKAKDFAAHQPLARVQTLNGDQIESIAGQVRHDILAEDEQLWKDPSYMSPKAQIIHSLMTNPGTPDSLTHGKEHKALTAFADSPKVREQAREKARASDLQVARTALARRELGALDQDFVLKKHEPRTHQDAGMTGSHGQSGRTISSAPLPGELTSRLAENGLDLPVGHGDRQLLGRAVLNGAGIVGGSNFQIG